MTMTNDEHKPQRITVREDYMEDLSMAVDAVLEYLEDRMDADHDGERYVPNEAMQLHTQLSEAKKMIW